MVLARQSERMGRLGVLAPAPADDAVSQARVAVLF
jgi:hypothetical protein